MRRERHALHGRHAGDADIEQVEAVAHELGFGAAGLIEDDPEFTFRCHDALINYNLPAPT